MSNKDATIEQINVFGQTFSSDEERRGYFREELRKKLPELRKIEGFPIGEDEDIINLSDPPYYTACPNPWLNHFVKEWDKQKKNLEMEGKRQPIFEVDKPYTADVSEGKNNPIYNAHSYHTKVPHPAIMRYILHYTQPGDIVFDGFAGTGMTGVAASLCGNPSEDFKSQIENEETNIQWGERRSICSDLSPIASFISYNYNTPINPSRVRRTAEEIFETTKSRTSWLFETQHYGNKIGKIDFIIWSDVYSCNECSQDIVIYDAIYDINTDKIKKEIKCENCGNIQAKNKMERVWITTHDSDLGATLKVSKVIPVLINYTYNKKRFNKKPDQADFELLDRINTTYPECWYPINRMIFGSEGRRNDRQGITHVHHFHTRRNLLALAEFWDEVSKIEDYRLSAALKLAASAANPNFSRMRRFRAGKKGGGPLSGTLYISSITTPQNALKSIKRNVDFVNKAFSLQQKTNIFNAVNYVGTSSFSGLISNSVDYIFTDPPFGSNIMYSELNFIWESWLKVFTNQKMEAIESANQNKSTLVYQNLMTLCFKEYYRVLKPGKWMTVEFSNTSAAVWNGIQTSIQNAGFVIANLAALDKKQGSFKAVTTVTAVKQDLVISCYKPSSNFDVKFKQYQNSDKALWDFVEEHLNHLSIHITKGDSTTAIIERSAKILFDRLIAFYVQKGLPVPIDAGNFHKGLRERFAQRDGMYFTQEQVQEYDRKKANHPEFVQLSILISSEQDGILWLKNLLQVKPQTYQDIHPKWMQALAGVRKGDIIPELSDILEENFLDDKSGKWYVPDPEKEADLERVRNRRLLKQYEEFKKEASKPKGKIKEARVEALRAGFKQSYQDKDFKTIVQVGDRIPNQLLMEDEVLLQFYDIASSRV